VAVFSVLLQMFKYDFEFGKTSFFDFCPSSDDQNLLEMITLDV
jgi:hypothetical protein